VTSSVLLWSAAGAFALLTAVWLVSLALRDVSIVDPAWGLAFVLVAWIAEATAHGCRGRRLLLAALVTVWGTRLALHLIVRKLREPGEDRRYARMREKAGEGFALRSLLTIFLLQAALVWIVSLPVQIAAVQTDRLGALDWIGAAVWAIGFAFEAIGDLQLSRFKADPATRGRVMDRGLWRYTRHPNYFGDFLLWWGIYLSALGTWGAAWTAVGPLVMSVLLIRVSGKDLLEKDIGRRRPGYEDYVRRTSGFVPLPPRRGSSR
jgi:steroid 5-alpha reductase family enzyme